MSDKIGQIFPRPLRERVRERGNDAKQTVNHLLTHLPTNLLTSKKSAFTLAEVLITLGIIGVVAALTIPALTQNYRKQAVETRLKQTYSVFKQAIMLSEVQNGEMQYWELPKKNDETLLAFFDKYIIKYVESYRASAVSNSFVSITLKNNIYTYWSYRWDLGADASFEVYVRFKPLKKGQRFTDGVGGKDYFVFLFTPYDSSKGFRPYGAEYSIETLNNYTGNNACSNEHPDGYHALCAAIIMKNGWYIPKDYPFRF